MESSEQPQLFTKQEKCGGCGGPLNQDDNWGCAHSFVPIMGMPMSVELHQHLHVGCANGFVKMLVLSNLGHSRAGLN